MLIKRHDPTAAKEAEVTEPALYAQRRRFLRLSAAVGLVGAAAAAGLLHPLSGAAAPPARLRYTPGKPLGPDDPLTPYEDITTYNNFYEFGTEKDDPSVNARDFKTHPWTIAVAGECDRPGTYALEDFIKPYALEERIYRMRCVEGWSMVIPWVGLPLGTALQRFGPNSRAKYVEFTTLYDPAQMPGQRRAVLDWPYVEGLRIDEAMHPLTLLAVGLYGRVLPNQDGAPIRLVVPWKYGFKGIKSIVKIRFVEHQPLNTWQRANPHEYGFYSNVNPHVDHPRWSQAKERRIGDFFKRPTLMFNGYGAQVARLYTGMDLRRYF